MTTPHGIHMVTGPFGYTGSHIARALREHGLPVAGLTGRPQPAGLFVPPLPVCPYDFERPDALASHLAGVDVLYNTYWVRFDRGGTTFDLALPRIETLLAAARQAGVRRVVHLSVTHASPDSPLPYFRGKGITEQMVRDSGLSYAILRPTLVFGAGARSTPGYATPDRRWVCATGRNWPATTNRGLHGTHRSRFVVARSPTTKQPLLLCTLGTHLLRGGAGHTNPEARSSRDCHGPSDGPRNDEGMTVSSGFDTTVATSPPASRNGDLQRASGGPFSAVAGSR